MNLFARRVGSCTQAEALNDGGATCWIEGRTRVPAVHSARSPPGRRTRTRRGAFAISRKLGKACLQLFSERLPQRKAPMSARPLLASLALAGTALLLASCGSEATPAGSQTPAESAAPTEDITVEHALGTTTIPASAERVASVGWGKQDVALALGIAPVGADDQTWSMTGDDGLGLYDWTLDAYDELGAEKPVIFDTTDGVDFEAIADTAPDVILAAYSGLTEDDYATLS